MSAEWTGKIVKRKDLRSSEERRFLRKSKNKAVILPYGNFLLDRRPVLLIHGAGNPGILRDVAARLHNAGAQVWFVFYDDLGIEPHRNGRRIAAELAALRTAYYTAAAELDIVAHSLGGIVARCALNTLQEPGWRRAGRPAVGPARAGFARVRVRTVDTPWSGFGSDDAADYRGNSAGARIVRKIMKLLGVGGAFQLGAGSTTLNHLFDVKLQDVDLQNLVARRAHGKDWVPSLPESTPKRAQIIARCIAFDERPTQLKLRNLCYGLRQDSRFPALRAAVRQAVIDEHIDLERRATRTLVRRLTKLHDRAMPRFEGRHINVVIDREDDAQDLVDHLVNELCSGAPPIPVVD